LVLLLFRRFIRLYAVPVTTLGGFLLGRAVLLPRCVIVARAGFARCKRKILYLLLLFHWDIRVQLSPIATIGAPLPHSSASIVPGSISVFPAAVLLLPFAVVAAAVLRIVVSHKLGIA